METALPILLFLGFLFAATLLILVCGIQGRDEMDEERKALAGVDLDDLPRFFGYADEATVDHPVALVVDEAAVADIEAFLREEMALVEVFIGDPSAERLHEHQQEVRRSPGMFERLDGYLANEIAAAARFVSNPSAAGLHAERGLQAVG